MSDHDRFNSFRALFSLRLLALLEASRLEGRGDMAGAWGWYRAMLRTVRHAGMRGAVDRRTYMQRWNKQLLERLTTWSNDPRTTPALIRRALDDVVACDALTVSETDSLKAAYLGVSRLLDSDHSPGREVPFTRFSQFWHPDYQLNAEQAQTLWDAWRWVRREPERSRRVIRLMTANWLAALKRAPADRPKPDPRVASFDYYSLGSESPPQARALAPESLDRWFDSAYDAQKMLPMLDVAGVRTVDRANHVAVLILLATELYCRDHGADPPTPEALVGPYLKSLP